MHISAMFTLHAQVCIHFKKEAAEEGRVFVLIFTVEDGEISIGYLLLNWMLNSQMMQMHWPLSFNAAENPAQDLGQTPHRGMALHK